MTMTRAGEAVIDEAERTECHILSINERVTNQEAVIAGCDFAFSFSWQLLLL
jgi:hypothetical protein